MQHLQKLILLTSFFVLAGAGLRAADGQWMTDFEAAQAKAAAENKLMLVDFTGSDWCFWCKRLDAEVLSQAEFQEYAAKNFVLVKLDFPRNQSAQPVEVREQNQRLLARYEVEGFPTIFLMDANGKPLAQTGYRRGGVEAYVEHLKELRKKIS